MSCETGQATTLNILDRIVETLAALPPDPLAQKMAADGFDPKDGGILLLPAAMRTSTDWGPWAPRTNSGHAFELAMNCGMAVCCGMQSCAAGVGNQHRSPIKDGDMMAAAREAVFMAAAELGKAMP